MKFLFIMMITLFATSAFAECTQREVQFIGTVSELKQNSGSFTIKVKPGDHVAPDLLCPIQESELEEASVEILGLPNVKRNQEISGVMIYDTASDSYSIESRIPLNK